MYFRAAAASSESHPSGNGSLSIMRARLPLRRLTDSHVPIRILHFISNSHPSGYFPAIARHADHGRFAIQVASLDRADGLQDELQEVGIPSFAIGAERRSEYAGAVVRLARWLTRHQIDVIHTHLFDASLVGLTAAQLARTRVAIFTGHHSHEVPLYQRRLFFEVDRFAARRLADVVIAPSQEMRETFLNVYRCRPENVEVIEHGVDVARFDPSRTNRCAVRRALGLEGKLVFGAVSKHFWIKNLPALVRAFAIISARGVDAHLVLLGLGDASSLARLVDDLGLTRRVSILPPRRDVPAVLAAFDVFVHPALAESFGFAVVEAMAMQRPVVATRVGIAREIVQDGVSGIEIAGTDADAIAAAMMRALDSRNRWTEMGAEARRRALTFTPERWVRAHERLYEERLRSG
jgi:glycosyltransferase involved in cell wall biosynthesis